MEYNCLNLPRRIQSERGDLIDYTYDAAGQKLRTVHTTVNAYLNIPMGQTKPVSSSQTKTKLTTDYCGNITYVNGKLDMIRFEDGYIKLTGGIPNTYFYMKDHLGNNRKVVSEWGSLAQQTNYYPSGMVYGETNPGTQAYKYSDKELDRMHGLDMYDFHARQRDMQIPMFTSPDPHAESYYNTSPYAYCANSFVNLIDPDGRDIVIAGDDEFRGKTFNDLQELTSTSLVMLKNGKIMASSDYDKETHGETLFTGTGSDKGKEFGTQMINELIASEHTVKIEGGEESKFGEYTSDAFKQTNGKDGKGSSGTVSYNPEDREENNVNADGTTGRPPYIGLAHELIHGLHAVKGQTMSVRPGFKSDPDTSGPGLIGSRGISVEEYNTRGQENIIRKEQRVPLRALPK